MNTVLKVDWYLCGNMGQVELGQEPMFTYGYVWMKGINMEDDGGLQYWQQLGMQEQFNAIFGEQNGINDSRKTKDTIPCEADILESGKHKPG